MSRTRKYHRILACTVAAALLFSTVLADSMTIVAQAADINSTENITEGSTEQNAEPTQPSQEQETTASSQAASEEQSTQAATESAQAAITEPATEPATESTEAVSENDPETEAAEETADVSANDLSEQQPMTYQATAEDGLVVHVTAPADAFSEEVSLEVDKLEGQETAQAQEKVADAVSDVQATDTMVTYDIHFVSKATGNEVEPAVPVQVSFDQIPLTGDVTVYHITDEQQVSEVANAAADTDSCDFETGSFSTFVLQVSGPTDGYNIAEGTVTITKAGTYTVSGTSDQGNHVVINVPDAEEDSVIVNLQDVTISGCANGVSAVELTAGTKATVNIVGDCSLTGGVNGAGVLIPETSEVKITGSGSLTAIGNNGTKPSVQNYKTYKDGGSGIGGSEAYPSFGKITIENLSSLTVQGNGYQQAGIGGNNNTAGIYLSNIQNLTAYGASVEGQSPELIAEKYGDSDFEGGPAIGAGAKGQKIGTISLTGCSDITVIGGPKSAAIGAGCWGTNSESGNDGIYLEKCSFNKIQGGSSSAGIGLSRMHYGCNINIVIDQCSISSVIGGQYGAAIGQGYNENSYGNLAAADRADKSIGTTNISITDSTVNAYGGKAAAAIGGGYKGHSCYITIVASTVYAQAGIYSGKSYPEAGASAIGCGADGSGIFTGGTINIAAGVNLVAVSNGDKWAIDKSCTTTGTGAVILQTRFLRSDMRKQYATGKVTPAFQEAEADAVYLDPSQENKVTVGEQAGITVPANYSCVAATQSAANGYSTVVSADNSYTPVNASWLSETATTSARTNLMGTPDLTAKDATFAATAGITYYDYAAFRPGVTPKENPDTPDNPENPTNPDTTGDTTNNTADNTTNNTTTTNTTTTSVTTTTTTTTTDNAGAVLGVKRTPDAVVPTVATDDAGQVLGASRSPKTSDESKAILWMLVMGASGIGMASLLAKKKREQQEAADR